MVDYPFLDGAVILVTGGTKGIGRNVAKRAAESNAKVYATFSRKLPDDAKELDGKVTYIRSDARDPLAARNLVQGIVSKHGRLDYVAPIAGVSHFTDMEDPKYDEHAKECMELNYGGVLNVVRPFITHLRQSGYKGGVLYTSSVAVTFTRAGDVGNPMQDTFPLTSTSPYIESKSAAESLVVGLSKIVNPYGDGEKKLVTAVVQPGCVLTDMLLQEARDLIPHYLARTGVKYSAEEMLEKMGKDFNACGRNLTVAETGKYLLDVLALCVSDRKSRVVPQPGGGVGLDYKLE